MERRAHIRQPIHLEARVSGEARTLLPGTIKDFCPGGLFLSLNGARSPFAQNETVEVQFSIPSHGTRRGFAMPARVAGLFGGGLGLEFVRPNPDALRALQELAGRTQRDRAAADAAAPGPEHVPADAPEILSACKRVIAEFLRTRTEAMFKRAGDDLFKKAREARNNAEQTECFDAMNELDRLKSTIEAEFTNLVVGQMDRLGERRDPALRSEGEGEEFGDLSLVDSDSFTDWLTVKKILEKAEPRSRDRQYEIQERLAHVAGVKLDEFSNPVSPHGICFSFHDAMQSLGAGRLTREIIFHAFEMAVVGAIDELYDGLDRVFKQHGVKLHIERPKPCVPHRPKSAAQAPERTPPEPEPDAWADAGPAPEEGGGWAPGQPPRHGGGPGGGHLGGPAAGGSPGGGGHPGGHPGGYGGGAPGGGYPGGAPGVPAGGPPGGPPGGAGPGYPGPGGTPGGPPGGAATGYPGQGGSPGGWQGPAPGAGGGPGTGYGGGGGGGAGGGYGAPGAGPAQGSPQGSGGAAPAGGGWGGAAVPAWPGQAPAAGGAPAGAPAEPGTGPAAAPGAPGAPAGGAARPDAFRTARNLLSLQRQIGVPSGGGGGTAARGAGAAGGDGTGLAEYETGDVLEALNRIQHDDETLTIGGGRIDFERRVQRELAARAGDGAEERTLGSSAKDAMEVIAGLVNAILHDPLIAEGIKSRIRRLSIPLLKVAMQDSDFLSNDVHPARQFVNRLGRLDVDESGDGQAGDTLLRETVDPLVQRIVEDYERDSSIFADALRELDAIVTRLDADYERNLEEVVRQCEQQQAMINARRKEAEARGVKPEEPHAAHKQLPEEWRQWLARAKRLQPGDALVMQKGSGPPEPLRVAWVGDEGNSFVLVDSKGHKAASLGLNEVAMHLRRGTAKVADAPDLPVMDRGLYSMLHGLHEKLVHEATHDRVTGLLNRKQFEARVEEALTDALRERSRHALWQVDLDSFEDIRERCGEKAGERLLRELSKVLEKHVGERGCIARLGGDTFAVLLENCKEKDALQVAERQRHAIDQSRCMWKGETFPLSVSIGFVPITHESRGFDELFEAVHHACDQAGQAGGNRIQVWQAPALPAEEPGAEPAAAPAPAPAPEVDVQAMLDGERLELRCQRVSPIGGDASSKPHYEILLGVRGTDGSLGLPAEFIFAAERANQMPTVDRWVIHTMFQWMASHRSRLARVGGYAINLSGHTLSDDKLIEYVLEEFSKSKVPPGKVVFEVTETAAISSLSTAADFIRVLKEYGCRFSLDDFGTGHSSYSYLKKLPVDFVKIDGMFVKDIASSESDLAMVRSINEIGHFMGKQTIAEYVESEEILELLKDIGVDFVQGFAIEQPMLLEEMQ